MEESQLASARPRGFSAARTGSRWLWVSACLAACDPYAGAEEGATEGHVRAYVVDHEDGTSRVGYALETAFGTYTELEPTPEVVRNVDRRVSVRGRMLAETSHAEGVRAGERTMLVDSLTPRPREAAAHTQAITDGTPRVIRVAAILLNFEGVTPQSATRSSVEGHLGTVRRYYQEISYGIWNIEYASFGPFQVAKPVDCDLGRIGNLAREAAANANVSLTGFDHVAVTLPANRDSMLDCACGVAWLGRTPSQRDPEVQRTSYYTCVESNAFAHELGHAFGLHHASTMTCNGQAYRSDFRNTCAVDEYGNRFNTMGNGLGHMNAFQKTTMRWLGRCNEVRVSRDGTFDLTPIQVASEGIQSLRIDTGDTIAGSPLYYFVEHRSPERGTFNAMDGNTRREKGAGVHIDIAQGASVTDGDGRPVILDLSTNVGSYSDPRLTAGRTYTDPNGRVTVRVTEVTADRARVEVTFPNGGTGANTCSHGALPPGSSGALAVYQHCDYGGWSASLPPGDYTAADLASRGIRDNDASSLFVNAGYEVTLFENADFTGASVTLTAASSCLVGNGFNDRVSSMRVRAVNEPMPDAGVPMPDAGMPMDASVPTDAGSPIDAGEPVAPADAGVAPSDDGGADDGVRGRFGGCTAAHSGSSSSLAVLVLALLFVRRRRV